MDDVHVESVQQWFAEHVTLDGKPYTLDFDQARAASDGHKNTLVTARAGSGKTRVIVAKVAYLVTQCGVKLDEIAIFMFNRTAAAEVNQRISAVLVDGQPLSSSDNISVASTFHKFALDLVKLTGEKSDIITESEHENLIRSALNSAIREQAVRIPSREFPEYLSIISGFITRAGQKYPNTSFLPQLQSDITAYCSAHADQPEYARNLLLHRLAYSAYRNYLQQLSFPKIDFNLLMSRATDHLSHAASIGSIGTSTLDSLNSKESSNSLPSHAYEKILQRIQPLRHLMIDEYQDFSYLFLAMTNAIRLLAPSAHLFAVGDDWQAINRFAGSDVDYFINFSNYFPEDTTNIPLATNYRSCRKIVEFANHFMLKHYDSQALPAKAFNSKSGKITYRPLAKTKFDASDYYEDRLHDGRYLSVLFSAIQAGSPNQPSPPSGADSRTIKTLTPAAKLLKSTVRIIQRHRASEIMLLHRHNFTSCPGVTLEVFLSSLRAIIVEEGIMTEHEFQTKIRGMTMHKSKGLESQVVILLEMDPEIISSHHPHSTIFELFGDTLAAETADQQRLIYVALTRAKERLYLISSNKSSLLS